MITEQDLPRIHDPDTAGENSIDRADQTKVNPLATACDYVRRGWSVVPVPFKKKSPVIKEWERLRLGESDLDQYFDQPANIGLILGKPSGGLVDVDLDCAEARELAEKYLPATPAKSGRGASENSHWWYIANGANTVQHRDPVTKQMIVELRSTGGQTVVGPSIHPSGEPYDVLTGEPAVVPAEMLSACVAALAERVIELRHGEKSKAPEPVRVIETIARTSSVGDIEQRALAYLDKMPPAISGNGGHAATYAAATVLVHGFEIDPERALMLLQEQYNPRCDPPWTEKELRHKVNSAAEKPHDQPRGWLLNTDGASIAIDPEVDLSGILNAIPRNQESTSDMPPPESFDPGPFPETLLTVPGFIQEIMAHNLATAHRRQPVLALGAAIALMGTLTGRKVCDDNDTRTNLYCLGVCPSGMGKEHARLINKEILYLAGAKDLIGPEGLASHAGLIRAVETQPAILFQLDEIGRLLRTLSDASRSPHLFHIATNLMKLYTSSNSLYVGDAYADPKRNMVISQPHACVYGTTSPRWLYEGLTAESISDGFLSRIMLLEATHVPKQRKVKMPIPEQIIDEARWWFEFNPGGNLSNEHPEPRIVESVEPVVEIFEDLDELAEREQLHLGDPLGTLWTRATEKARKLALIYACSDDREEPRIDMEAATWSCQVSEYLTRRMIYLAGQWIAENPYDAKRKRILRAITEAGPDGLSKTDLYTKTRAIPTRERNDIIQALILCGDVRPDRDDDTGGAPRVRLVATIFPEKTSS